MIKFAIPAVLVGISIALFFTFASPMYQEIKSLRALSVSYNDALGNSKTLEAERDKLTRKYNTIHPEDIARLEKVMPDSVDNIRLILEIEKLALPYGMTLQEVGYATTEDEKEEAATAPRPGGAEQPGSSRTPYGIWNLSFTTEGSYDNFVNLLKDLENNLRVVDISSISFAALEAAGTNPNLPQAYEYKFNIHTYWLKN